MPPRSISAIASRVPSATNSGPDPPRFGGPDPLPQPVVERQVVGEAAKQRHGERGCAR